MEGCFMVRLEHGLNYMDMWRTLLEGFADSDADDECSVAVSEIKIYLWGDFQLAHFKYVLAAYAHEELVLTFIFTFYARPSIELPRARMVGERRSEHPEIEIAEGSFRQYAQREFLVEAPRIVDAEGNATFAAFLTGPTNENGHKIWVPFVFVLMLAFRAMFRGIFHDFFTEACRWEYA